MTKRNITKKKAKMAELSNYIVCGFCQEEVQRSVLDACDTLQSCPQCGSVLAEEQIFNYDIPVSFVNATLNSTQGSSSRSFQTQNDYEDRNRQQKLHPNQVTPRKRELKGLVSHFCQELQVPKETTEQIQVFLMEKVYQVFVNMQRKIRMVGACIYIICRNNKLTITLKQIAVVTGTSVFELGNVAKLIDKTFHLHHAPVTVQSLITTACSDLPRGKECEELAQSLHRHTSESMVLNGSRMPQAISYCVLASLALNKGTNQRGEIKKLCLNMSQVSEITVERCIRLLKNYIVTLLQTIPWINMKYVKYSNIHYYIKDILKYEQTCGKFPAKVTNPQWCHERESKIQTRKQKIQNALERIRQRQHLATSGNENVITGTEKRFDPVATGITIDAQGNTSVALETTLGPESNITTEFNTSVPAAVGSPTADSAELNCSLATDMLDEEDKVIEELLEIGCSPQQLQEGFYENLKITSSTIDHEINESEIESYVRKPDEVNELKRMAEQGSNFDTNEGRVKKRQRGTGKCRTKPIQVNCVTDLLT